MKTRRKLAIRATPLAKLKKHKCVYSAFIAFVAVTTVVASSVFLRPSPQAAAVLAPESCFVVSGTTEVTITGYYDYEDNLSTNSLCPKDIEIPNTIGGLPVTTIGDSAFSGKQLAGVFIPDSVKTIGNLAFYDNRITSMTVPSGVESIGTQAFGAQSATMTIDQIETMNPLFANSMQLTS